MARRFSASDDCSRSAAVRIGENVITKVTFTQNQQFINIHFVVWQFWGRAAEASLTEKSRALFLWPYHRRCPALLLRARRAVPANLQS